jgi:hypothetical protein
MTFHLFHYVVFIRLLHCEISWWMVKIRFIEHQKKVGYSSTSFNSMKICPFFLVTEEKNGTIGIIFPTLQRWSSGVQRRPTRINACALCFLHFFFTCVHHGDRGIFDWLHLTLNDFLMNPKCPSLRGWEALHSTRCFSLLIKNNTNVASCESQNDTVLLWQKCFVIRFFFVPYFFTSEFYNHCDSPILYIMWSACLWMKYL